MPTPIEDWTTPMPRMLMRRTNRLGMTAVMGLDAYTRTHTPKELLGLIQLRASHLNGCHYCIDLHTRTLRKQGEPNERIDALAGVLPSQLFTERENAVLALTDQATRLDAGGVTDATWDALTPHFTPQQIGDLILAIAAINTWNRIAITTQLDQ